MTHTTMNAPGCRDTQSAQGTADWAAGMDAVHGYFWGLVDAAQFAFTALTILVGLTFAVAWVL